MSAWSSGYVTDVGYTFGFYRELTPNILALAVMSAGNRAVNTDAKFSYCELGCGQGFTANLLASASPNGEFYATDFNPGHIAGARHLAQQAGAGNVHFYEDSFADFVGRSELPEFDIVVFHGIYSWIEAQHRQSIIDFVRRKLKPGGVVYNSYNALPGWAAAAPLRHLLYLHGRMQGGPTADRLTPALDFADRLKTANATFFRSNPALGERLEKLRTQSPNYLAHEYMNDAWTLFYFSDVMEEMQQAKLSYLTQANLVDHVDAVNYTQDQRTLLAEIKDPIFRETLRDYMTGQQFRRDIYVKGRTPFSRTEWHKAWGALRLVASKPKEGFDFTVRGHLGNATMSREVYEPIVEAFADGPQVLSDLLARPQFAKSGWDRIIEAVRLLVGSGHLNPALAASGDTQRAKRTRQFNNAVMARSVEVHELDALASPVTGGGEPVDRISQLFLLARQRKLEPAKFAWDVLNGQGQRVLKDGKALETPEENIAEIGLKFAAFEKRIPVLQQLGIA